MAGIRSIHSALLQGTLQRMRGESLSALDRWKERFTDSQARERYGRVADPLLGALDRKLSAFETSLTNFQWPGKDSPWSGARLAVADTRAAGKLHTALYYDDDIIPRYKYISADVNPVEAHALDQRDYSMRLTLGGAQETVSVPVTEAEKTWGDVLAAVETAINNASLPVQAQVVTQLSPGARIPGVAKVGTMLALYVDPGRSSQDLELDRRDVLTRTLNFDQAPQPSRPQAEAKRYDVAGKRAASPTAYVSSVFDPNADAGLSAGQYALEWSLGDASGTIWAAVDQGATYQEALEAVARAVNLGQDVFRAEVARVPRQAIAGSPPQRIVDEGVVLTIRASDPKERERLFFGLPHAKDFWDFSVGLPPQPENGPYIADVNTVSGAGYAVGNVYVRDNLSWIGAAPEQGRSYYIDAQRKSYTYDGSQWTDAQAYNLAGTLGLGKTARPGVDGHMEINGREQTSATSTFSADRGALHLGLDSSFGETLPVKVVEAMEAMDRQVGDAVNGYNGVRSVLLKDPKMWEPDAGARWRDAVQARRADLSWLGFMESGPGKLLWVDADQFWKAVLSDPDRAKAVLTADVQPYKGLLTEWSETNDGLRRHGLETLLADPSALQDTEPPWGRVERNEEDDTLLNLYG